MSDCQNTTFPQLLIAQSNSSYQTLQDKTAKIPRRGGFSTDDRTTEGNSIIKERTEQLLQGRIVV